MKFIGEYIQDLIARFRNDVYLEDISTGTIASGANLGLDSNNKIVKADVPTGDINQVSFTSDSGSFGITTGDADFTISGGEGIDTSMSTSTITIAGEDASDSNKGIVELATTAEADTGTDTTRAVTPAGLKSHVDNRYAYQYLNWEVNTNSFTSSTIINCSITSAILTR